MMLKLTEAVERVRSSLFFVPMEFVVVGIVLAEAAVTVDQAIGGDGDALPLRLSSTVDGSREILGTVAGATITFAGIAFSIALLIVQMTSSQYSPRVVHGLFRDPFNKRVMGLVVGTFTYCLVVLRSVRSALEEGGDDIVPHLSVALAVVLGIAAVLAIVAFIDHAAHRMDVSEILQHVTRDTLERAEQHGGDRATDPAPAPPGEGTLIRARHDGWVQQVDHGALLATLPPSGTVELHTAPGRYAVAGTALATVWPRLDDDTTEDVAARIGDAVSTGDTRTMQQDLSYGLRQVVDVALRALSTGVNDPTTAQDAIFHAAAILRGLLGAPAVRVVDGDGGRRVLVPEAVRPDELVGLAFDEVRLAAAAQPSVCIYLLEAIRLVLRAVEDLDDVDTATEALRSQADLIVRTAESGGLPVDDVRRVRDAHASRFGQVTAVTTG